MHEAQRSWVGHGVIVELEHHSLVVSGCLFLLLIVNFGLFNVCVFIAIAKDVFEVFDDLGSFVVVSELLEVRLHFLLLVGLSCLLYEVPVL